VQRRWRHELFREWALSDAIAQLKHVLFICSRNQWRSPTAEQVFSTWPGIAVTSAGLDPSAAEPVTPELLAWADIIFVWRSKPHDFRHERERACLGHLEQAKRLGVSFHGTAGTRS
jgi:predicted protein tyrosine phosphatase